MIHLWSEPTEIWKKANICLENWIRWTALTAKIPGKMILSKRLRQTNWMARGRLRVWKHMLLLPLSAWNLIFPTPKLTCDDTGEGAAHSHWRVRGGSPAKGRHDQRCPTKRSEGSYVAIVVRLRDWRVTHQSGVGPIVSEMCVHRRCIWVLWPILRRWSLVLFTSDTSHCQAYKEDISD